jgi:SAM-dependent methyltransferase
MTQTAASGFSDARETWNRRFQGDAYLFGTEPNEWLRRHAGAIAAGGRVLAVADGEGRNSVWLARQGFAVDAFDVAEVGVAKARALATRHGVAVNFEVADVDGWAWPEARYDGIAAIFVQFAHPALRERLFARMVRALRPGGVLLLQGYTPRQLDYRTGGPPQVEHLYTEALLREAFAALDIERLEDYEAEVAEGSGHLGRSALIGLVARRRLPAADAPARD